MLKYSYNEVQSPFIKHSFRNAFMYNTIHKKRSTWGMLRLSILKTIYPTIYPRKLWILKQNTWRIEAFWRKITPTHTQKYKHPPYPQGNRFQLLLQITANPTKKQITQMTYLFLTEVLLLLSPVSCSLQMLTGSGLTITLFLTLQPSSY